MHMGSRQQAAERLARLHRWCEVYDAFLRERSEDKSGYRHGKLRRARRGLVRLCNEGSLFTYPDDGLVVDGAILSTSNRIESLNGRIRRMLGFHHGMSVERRMKAVFWFCYISSEAPVAFAEMLGCFPDDRKVLEWRRQAARAQGDETGVGKMGRGNRVVGVSPSDAISMGDCLDLITRFCSYMPNSKRRPLSYFHRKATLHHNSGRDRYESSRHAKRLHGV